jgi:hypothetical protein
VTIDATEGSAELFLSDGSVVSLQLASLAVDLGPFLFD